MFLFALCNVYMHQMATHFITFPPELLSLVARMFHTSDQKLQKVGCTTRMSCSKTSCWQKVCGGLFWISGLLCVHISWHLSCCLLALCKHGLVCVCVCVCGCLCMCVCVVYACEYMHPVHLCACYMYMYIRVYAICVQGHVQCLFMTSHGSLDYVGMALSKSIT